MYNDTFLWPGNELYVYVALKVCHTYLEFLLLRGLQQVALPKKIFSLKSS